MYNYSDKFITKYFKVIGYCIALAALIGLIYEMFV